MANAKSQIQPEAPHAASSEKKSADQALADKQFNVVHGLNSDAKVKDLSREELEKQLEHLKAQVYDKEHPFAEFPKMVKGKIFQSREAQQDAGPEYAD